MGYPRRFITLVSCFCLVAAAPFTPEKDAEEENSQSISVPIIPDEFQYELQNYPERAKVQLYKILSLRDPYKRQSLLTRWTNLYTPGHSSKLDLASLLRFLSKGKREKFFRTVEYEYGIPLHSPRRTKVKYSRKVTHFNQHRAEDDLLTLPAPRDRFHSGRKQFSSSSEMVRDVDPEFDPANNLEGGESESLESEDAEDVDRRDYQDLEEDASKLLESAPEASDSEEVLPEDLPSADETSAPDRRLAIAKEPPALASNNDAESSPVFYLHSQPPETSLLPPHVPDWLKESHEDFEDLGFPTKFSKPQEELQISLDTSKEKQLKYYELWKVLHPECLSLDCVPPELWPEAGSVSIDIPVKPPSSLQPASNSCRHLTKLMVTLWKKLSVYSGSSEHKIPPSPDLKKILFLIHFYLKLNQQHNLSQQPILSQYSNIDFAESPVENPLEIPEDPGDFANTDDPDGRVEFPDVFPESKNMKDNNIDEENHHPEPVPQKTREQLLRTIIQYYRQNRKVPNQILKLIIRTLLLEIVPDFNRPRTKCEQKAFVRLFKRVSHALRAYLNREECQNVKTLPKPRPNDLLGTEGFQGLEDESLDVVTDSKEEGDP